MPPKSPILYLLFCLPLFLKAQHSISTDAFINPLDIPIILSGSFGELRSNHFHSGIDIKTEQRIGLPVRAVGTGYVSRINIKPWGFGYALYIQHPNGFSSVYAHLNDFAPKIKKYVRKLQYARESWEIEEYLEPDELPVEQGEIIAYSGNTGSSGGPHLHFEIREGSIPMNPLLFGYEIPDSRPPLIQSLFVYPIGDSAYVENSATRKKLRLIPDGKNAYRTEEIQALGEIGFGISTVDRFDGAYNKNGVYKIESFCNGSKNLEIVFDKFSFAETRYINRMIDYSYYKEYKNRVQKLFVQPNNPLSVYKHVVDKGLIDIQNENDYIYEIKVSDIQGNTSTIKIPIKGIKLKNINFPEVVKTNYYALANNATVFEEGKFDVYIPEGALYENTYLDISIDGETIHLHNDKTPLHKNISIGIDISNYEDPARQKLCFARTYPWGSKYYSNTYREKNRLTTHTRTFGTYTLTIDDKPPTVEPVNFYDGQWISKNKTLKVKIEDDFSGISAYRGTVNGKFIVMEYNPDNGMLTYEFADGIVTDTENNLKVIVTDNVGNSTIFEAVFHRKK
ncbi:MAG TPA: M23 family metallopeptidase [Flavobacteriaceae bacterium]|nr:M23 family metallopeptidase [Flavobacteriaceae bacterium]